MSRPRVLSSLRREFNEAELELKEFVMDKLALTSRKLSRMRDSISLDKKGKATTDRGKIARIRNTRGAFLWLPVKYENDLVHGSWWFVYGSLMSTVIPIIPLMDIHLHIFVEPEGTVLNAFANSSTWVFLIISGLFFTIGSWVFIRAFEQPPPEPLFPDIHHLCTDELVGAWLFLLAVIPCAPYCIVFLAYSPRELTYLAALVASLFFIAGSAFFVYTCYPNNKDKYHSDVPAHYVLPIVERIFGEKSWICKHCKTDWLVSCWLMYYSTFLWMFGSYIELFHADNDRQVFVWVTSFFNALLYLIGCAYYVSGSYTTEHEHEEFDQFAQDINDDGTMLAYFENLGKKRKQRKPKVINTTVNVIHDALNTNIDDDNNNKILNACNIDVQSPIVTIDVQSPIVTIDVQPPIVNIDVQSPIVTKNEDISESNINTIS